MTKFDPSSWPQTVCGEYRLQMILGTGRKSAVYIAKHISTGELAAVKIYHQGDYSDAAQISAPDRTRLSHPGIVRQLAYGKVRGDYFYTVQEYSAFKRVGGTSSQDCCNLEEYLAKVGGQLDEDTVRDFMTQLIDALVYAHQTTGIPYGGLSPKGIMVSEGGSYADRAVLRICDLGLPAIRTADSLDDACIAPEEISGLPGEQSDIFALGAICHLLLEGELPSSPMGVPSIARHDVSKGWTGLVQKAMAYRPEERFASYQELLHAVNHIDDVPVAKPEAQPQRFFFYLSCLICFLLLLGFAFRDSLRSRLPIFDKLFPAAPAAIKPVAPPKGQQQPSQQQQQQPAQQPAATATPKGEVPRIAPPAQEQAPEDPNLLKATGTSLDGVQDAAQKAEAEAKAAAEKAAAEAKAAEEKAAAEARAAAEKAAAEAKAAAEKAAAEAKAAAEKAAAEAKAKLEAEAKAAAEKAKETVQVIKAETLDKAGEYTVKKGDTLWNIARAAGIKVADLLEWNGLSDGNVLKEGMVLKLAAPKAAAETAAPAAAGEAETASAGESPATAEYEVQSGDTYFSLSKKLGCTVQALQELNESRPLKTGEKIRVPKEN